MIITKLEMTRFGKFRDAEVTLKGGLSTYVRANESGKTTTADFIRFMFYGLPHRGRKIVPLGEDLLEKYQPWDSEEGLRGAVEFTDEEGKGWRIERTQNRKGKGTARLLDAHGRLATAEDVGQRFLGVDAETFSNIFFVRESRISFRRTEQMEIAMRNLVTTGNESVGYDSVMEFLNAEKEKYLSPKGNSGKLKRTENAIAALREQIAARERRLEQLQGQAQAEQADAAALTECEAELEQLQAAERQLQAYRLYQNSQKRAELAAMAAELTAALEQAQHPLTPQQIADLRAGFTATREAAFALEQARKELESFRLRVPAFNARDEEILANEGALRAGNGRAVLPALGTAVLVAAGALLRNPLCWIAAGVLGLTALILGWTALRLPTPLRKMGITRRSVLYSEVARAKAARAQYEMFVQQRQAAEDTVQQRQSRLQAIEQTHLPLRQQTGITDPAALDGAIQNGSRATVLRERLQYLYARMDELGDVTDAVETPAPALTAEEIARQRQQLHARKDLLQANVVQHKGERLAFENERQALLAEKDRLMELERQAEEMRRALEVVTVAIGQMNAAQAALREDYAPRLRAAMGQKLALLTNGKYDTVTLDEELGVRIKAEGGLRELAYFSTGTADAAMLALRLSLAEILEGEKRLPMIFDDAFLHLDDRRLQVLLQYLQRAGAQRQILLLSCRDFDKT